MSKTGKAQRAASRAQDSKVLHGAARAGFVVNGLLHIVIGFIALGIAFGDGGEADAGGALSQLGARPGGQAILWGVAVGLWGLAAFEILETVLIRGTDKEAWGVRAKAAAKAIGYLAVGVTAATFAVGGSSDSGKQTQDFTAQLLGSPGGVLVLVVVAVGVLGVGVYFIAKGIRRRFIDDITVPAGTGGQVILTGGVVGYVAKGIAVAIVGMLFGAAAVTTDAGDATGLDGALKALTGLPLGNIGLTMIALGLVSYGVYCFVRAVYARL
ncbi:MAG: DUF1206 domain-containing protein [Homoserinimonas sp.]